MYLQVYFARLDTPWGPSQDLIPTMRQINETRNAARIPFKINHKELDPLNPKIFRRMRRHNMTACSDRHLVQLRRIIVIKLNTV